MAVPKSVLESAFGKGLGLTILVITESMTDSVVHSIFSKTFGLFNKHESFTINGSDEVCAKVCL